MEEQSYLDFEKEFAKARTKMGHVNILLAGKTGVGKSTLLNAVFKEDLAKTGIGRPITQHSQEYTKDGSFVSIIDTKGFELDGFNAILEELRNSINSRKTENPLNHVHVAWYCIRSGDRRIEEAESNFIQELSKELPVIVVITQSYFTEQEFFDDVVKKTPFAKKVIRVLAQDMVDDGIFIKAHGLDELTSATYDLIPEAFQSAFASAQKVNMDIKKQQARKAIAASSTAAATACVVPVPFADSAMLAPIQIGMLASISHIMGMELSTAFIATLVTSAAAVTGATIAGRAIVTGILKLIPGAGTVLGTAIGAATATALTTAMGEAYLNALCFVLSTSDNPTADEIADAFKKALKKEKLEITK